MTCDMWHVTHDTWHVTCDTFGGGGEDSLKISAPQLLPFVIYDIMKIWRKRMSDWINHEAVYRTAPATPGLLKTSILIEIAK